MIRLNRSQCPRGGRILACRGYPGGAPGLGRAGMPGRGRLGHLGAVQPGRRPARRIRDVRGTAGRSGSRAARRRSGRVRRRARCGRGRLAGGWRRYRGRRRRCSAGPGGIGPALRGQCIPTLGPGLPGGGNIARMRSPRDERRLGAAEHPDGGHGHANDKSGRQADAHALHAAPAAPGQIGEHRCLTGLWWRAHALGPGRCGPPGGWVRWLPGPGRCWCGPGWWVFGCGGPLRPGLR